MKYILLVFDKIEEAGMAIGMFIMVIMNFFNVVCRFLLPQTPFSYTEEFTVLIFIWVTMLGISCGYKRASHTGLNILTERIHGVPKGIIIIFATICSSLFAALLFRVLHTVPAVVDHAVVQATIHGAKPALDPL